MLGGRTIRLKRLLRSKKDANIVFAIIVGKSAVGVERREGELGPATAQPGGAGDTPFGGASLLNLYALYACAYAGCSTCCFLRTIIVEIVIYYS